MDKIRCCVPCLFGLESLVAQELKSIGAQEIESENGRVFFSGTKETLVDANLWLRTGQRVEIVLGQFPAKSFEELFEGVRKLPWEEWIEEDGRFPVKGHALNSKLHSVPDCQKIVKKAIVRRLEGHYKRSIFPENGALFSVRFSIFKDQAVLMLDTSGNALHKRGYRPAAQPAPLRETLAAAMVMLARPYPDTVLYDPFCGSGTLLIEGAMLARNMAPGIGRGFSAENWQSLPRALWQERRKAAKALAKRDIPFRGFGFDIDPKMAAMALDNAKRAGVADCLAFQTRDVKEFTLDTPRGMVVTNPPYGERLLDVEQARALYKVMGKVFLKQAGWRYFVISPEKEFEKIFGRPADKRRKVYNGTLECNIYQYFKSKE
ncbi:MAG: class I SAM-dependent RNA methyltransferase [Clostridia bacterium]|nr:class I SAM-dependent RNA methyltransferase [Clostridia bacterium]